MQNRRGFTLIELTVVLLIISFVVSGGMVTFTAYVKKSQSDITIARMDEIEKALINYGTSFGRLPCPASLTLTKSSLNTALYGAFAAGTYGIYGVEAENSGSCTGGTNIASNFASASGVVEGAVPVRALGLPDAYIYDGWGHRFRYAVDPDFTSGTQSPPRGTILPMPTGGYCNPSVKTITIKDSQGAAKTTSAIYALISHGQNGHGGYNASGAITNAGSANTDEQKNCHCNSSAASTANDAIYVQKALTNDTSNAANSFDDIVAFKEAWQIQNGTSTAITPDCIYVVDNINHIYKYLLNARTWSEVLPSVDPNFATPAGATTILSVATNSNGDLFTVASRGAASNLRKYSNSTGTWNNSFDVSSPTTGSSISLDSLGNSYIVNASSILVYNSA
ncbi:MAG: type II secretion system protein, partial [Pseudomonadota bacterium]